VKGVQPFLTLFPAVPGVAPLLGARWGAVILIGSAIICYYFFTAPVNDWPMSTKDILLIALFLMVGSLIVDNAELLRQSAHRLQAASAREYELSAELQHRVNNNLMIVQSLADQTARYSPGDFYDSFSRRIHALREATTVLSETAWTSCDLPRLVERGLKAFHPSEALTLEGPACILPPGACVPLTLALHELSTNAVKYGALSVPEGRVAVRWAIEGGALKLYWRESLGPRVAAPAKGGLGTRLLRAQTGLDDVTIDYPPDGLRCSITIEGAREA